MAASQGACGSGKWDPELWFPLSYGEPQSAPAVAICRTCPIQMRCLAGALDREIWDGIWGGLTPEQRSKLTPQQRRMIEREADGEAIQERALLVAG